MKTLSGKIAVGLDLYYYDRVTRQELWPMAVCPITGDLCSIHDLGRTNDTPETLRQFAYHDKLYQQGAVDTPVWEMIDRVLAWGTID